MKWVFTYCVRFTPSCEYCNSGELSHVPTRVSGSSLLNAPDFHSGEPQDFFLVSRPSGPSIEPHGTGIPPVTSTTTGIRSYLPRAYRTARSSFVSNHLKTAASGIIGRPWLPTCHDQNDLPWFVGSVIMMDSLISPRLPISRKGHFHVAGQP